MLKPKTAAFCFLGLLLLFFDRASKAAALFSARAVFNEKLYFISLSQVWLYFFIVIGLLLVLFLLAAALLKKDLVLFFAFWLVFLGGLSNLWDRVLFGYVVDWLKTPFLSASFFNLADVMIIAGLLLCLIEIVKTQRKTAEKNV